MMCGESLAILRFEKKTPCEISVAVAQWSPDHFLLLFSTTPRRIANVGDDDLVLLVVGGKGGYIERDGHVMSDEDLEIRKSLGKEQA